MSEPFLPYGRQTIDDADIAAVVTALKADFLTTGPKVAEFERAFAAKVGARHAVVCSNGTAALHLAALAAGYGEGDSVVCSTMTFLATANAARYVGAEVVFADCDPRTALTGPADVEAAVKRATSKVAAIHVVHMNGQSCDMEAIQAIARRIGAVLIEDACHAIGTTYRTRSGESAAVGACRHSDMACFSLHPTKTMTMGEGGVITTNDSALNERLQRLRMHGYMRDAGRFEQKDLAFDDDGTANPWYYEMPEVGFNYRATDIQCALGLSQLAKLDGFADRRKALTVRYDRLFEGFHPHAQPFSRVQGCDPVLHLYPLLIDFKRVGKSRAKVMRELATKGIGTQVHYLPVHRQPYYERRYGRAELPGAEAYYAKALSIPLYPAMADADADRVVATFKSVLGQT